MRTLALLLFACRTTPDPAPAPPELPVSAPEAVSPTKERITITLDPAMMTYDEAAGAATFSPGSHVRAASYSRYVLDLVSLEQALGGRPEAPVDVVVELGAPETYTESPEDPMMAQPDGGFHITTWTGRVIEAAAP